MFCRFLTPLAFAACTAVSVLPLVSCGPVSIDLSPRTPAAGIDVEALAKELSENAQVYVPSDEPFAALTVRWSNLEPPSPNVVVVAAIEEDVSQTVAFAYKNDIPILAYNGHHGTLVSLGKMDYGIQIYLGQLNSLAIAEDGKTVTVGGGINSHNLTESLWTAGKQAVTGTCECVSYLGPALGGGHGWLQGHHGLISDQFESLNVVLANGDLKTIDSTSDLWWGMLGAGQNFGIVTSATSKVYDIVSPNWAIETIVFGGDKLEAVYEAASEALLKNGNQTDDVQNYSYWQNDATLDPNNPVIIMYIMQEGVNAVDPAYTKPFHDLEPLKITPQSGDYRDLAAWTGIALDSPPCQDFGFNNPRFPIYLPSYNVTAMRAAYDIYAAAIGGADNPWTNSIFMFEDYATSGVRERDQDSTAFAFREDLLLAAPLIIYNSTGAAEDETVKDLGNQLREIIREGSGREELHAYVNYAYGDEGVPAWFGAEEWRGDRLGALKKKYDPTGVFNFYAPIV